MKHSTVQVPEVTIGIDLGDKFSYVCSVSAEGRVIGRERVATRRESFTKFFGKHSPARVVIECGTHSPWVSRLLEECGHEVIIANPRWASRKARKTDKIDAEQLARQGRIDPSLLHPIRHRGVEAQRDLAVIRGRLALIEARTKLINHVRGVVKSFGYRIRSCSAEAFANRAEAEMPEELKGVFGIVIEAIRRLTEDVRSCDKQVEQISKRYPETKQLRQVKGVGVLTALAFVLVIEDPRRFESSRLVGPYLGLVGRKFQTGDSDPQLRITKSGDKLLRCLLTSSAHYIMGPFGEDCDLFRHGEGICRRGGMNAKKRAITAVARKLSVLLHALWISGAKYEPLRNSARSKRNEKMALSGVR